MDRVPTTGTGGAAERLETLSDGVFAIAMTLLVLDVSVPPGLNSAGFHEALGEAVPNLAAYALSFAVIAQFWRDHRRLLGVLPAPDGTVTGLTLLGLALIALLPFPTALLAEYGDEPLAVAIYSGSVAGTNAAHLALLLTIHRRLPPPAAPDTVTARRLDAADLGSTVLVFGIAVPLAFASPAAAKWFWLILVPAKVAIDRRQRRVTPRSRHGR
ncbi:TMEM175 family protein [Streptomyces sp. 8N616]|uniref:TMEM175 family protein n=1 Tax=Streptomyces sp. 8N616 TaxID=3457414 RepID=UPI003FD21D92